MTNTPGAAETGRHGIAGWAVPVVIFVFSAVITYLSTTFDKAPEIVIGHSMQPRAFPMFLMAVMAVLNCVLIAQMLRTAPGKRSPILWQTYAVAACFLIFYLVTSYVDMFIAMALVLLIIGYSLGASWPVAALTAVATPVVIFFTFDLVLRVRFPRGLLTNLYYG